MTVKTNLVVNQNADFVYNIYLIDVYNRPFDITGYSGNSVIRKSYTSNTYIPINVAIGGNNGIISLTMNAATTADLTQTRYVYDLILQSNTGVVSRITEGIVSVDLGVT